MSIAFAVLYGNIYYPMIIIPVSMVYPLVMLFRQRDQHKRWVEKTAELDQAYRSRMQEVEDQLEKRASQQKAYLQWTHPDPTELTDWVRNGSDRVWERRADDSDFMQLRMGVGEVNASYTVKVPAVEIPELAPTQLLDAREMALSYRKLSQAPIGFDFRRFGSLGIAGPRRLREALARAVVTESAALQAPADLEIFGILPSNRIASWNWMKWLPHTRAVEGAGARVHLGYDRDRIAQLLSGILDELEARSIKNADLSEGGDPFLLVVVADAKAVRGEAGIQRLLSDGPSLGAGLILLTPNSKDLPHGCQGRVEIRNEEAARFHATGGDGALSIHPDSLSENQAEYLARWMAPMRLGDSQLGGALPDQIRLMELAGNPDLDQLDFKSRWMTASTSPPNLRIPLGMRHGGRPLELDLRQSGHGPHGLIAGTTGSGKSELLLTLLSALAFSNHPHQVNFVLVDYKGGTAMSVLSDLPHTVGVVTDLDGKQTRRALVALRSELMRREEILARHEVADIDKYHELGIAEPFPYLFIVIDEFAELKERFKYDLGEVLNEFVSVAQKGRALGVHLILAMQRPEGVVNDAIRANMRYRICLRVERAEDSRNVLGRPDAYLLPGRPPGRAYFQVGKDEQFDLFQVARVAGFYRRDGDTRPQNGEVVIQEVTPDGRRIRLVEVEAQTELSVEGEGPVRTEAQILVEKAAQAAGELEIERLKSPWPPPLPTALAVEELFELAQQLCWDGSNWPDVDGSLSAVPIGLLDEPGKQRQIPLRIDLEKSGNLLVVGSPGSGRTILALTLVASLARAHAPDVVHFHLVDAGGHELKAGLSQLPHVSGVYGQNDRDRISRLLATLLQELDSRRRRFEEAGVADLTEYRQRDQAEDQLASIVTVINGFSAFTEFALDEVDRWISLIREGRAYGLHFVLTSDRLPTGRVADLMQARIALRLADQTMYSVILNARPELTTFDPVPGRGFWGAKPPVEVHIALPCRGAVRDQIPELQKLSSQMDQAWIGSRPEPVQLLGEQLSLAQVLEQGRSGERKSATSWIGLNDEELEPVEFDLRRAGAYFLIAGPPESGKTTALATLSLALSAIHGPNLVQLALITPNRAERYRLDTLAKLPHLIAHAKTEATVKRLLDSLEAEAAARSSEQGPGEGSNAHIMLLIDDYHLLSGRVSSEQLTALELLAKKGADIGLTTLLTVPSTVLATLSDPLIRQAKAWRSGIWLQSTDSLESSSLGIRVPISLRGRTMPPGRGFLYDPSGQRLIQLASPEVEWPGNPDQPSSLAAWVELIAG
jgi:S-DNA-T family DNA segregation ATPase FtsK/SpoIIIE